MLREPERGSPVAAVAARRVLSGAGAGGRSHQSERRDRGRLCPSGPRGAGPRPAGCRGQAGGWVAGRASSDFRYCAPPEWRGCSLVSGSGRRPVNRDSPTLSEPLLQLHEESGRRELGRSGQPGLKESESWGPSALSFSRLSGLLAGRRLARRSRPLGALPKFVVAQGLYSRQRTCGDLAAECSLGSLNAELQPPEVARRRGCRETEAPTGQG